MNYLTDRELQILQAVAEGKPSKQIARDLGISIWTVKTHRQRISQKLRLSSISEITRYAVQIGLVDGDPPDTVRPSITESGD